MRRKTFDTLVSSVGVLLAVILAVAGGLLLFAGNFAHSQVTDQLAAQKVYFPPAGSDALKSDAIGPYLDQYAGQQLTTGPQAQIYANHFIAVHLSEIGGGKTYSELSAAAMKDPNNAALQGQVATVFKGETLRGLLLNAYAFWTVGTIALWGAIAAFVGSVLLLVLSLFGFVHAGRVPPAAALGAPAIETIGEPAAETTVV
jgi:hypothetical protein